MEPVSNFAALPVPFKSYKFKLHLYDKQNKSIFDTNLVERVAHKIDSYSVGLLEVVYREDEKGSILEAVAGVMSKDITLHEARIVGFNDYDVGVFEYRVPFNCWEHVTHSTEFDYTTGDVLKHKLTFSFGTFSFKRL